MSRCCVKARTLPGRKAPALGGIVCSCLFSLVIPAQAQNAISYYITTLAGNGSAGMSGDGGPGISAQLNNPMVATEDLFGNLYIADSFNNRVRKFGSDGMISTCAGGSTTPNSGDGGVATSAGLNHPSGVALAKDGTLYIADTGSSVIRKVSTGGTITRVAGTGAAGYSGDGGAATSASLNTPMGLALDAAGNLYIADSLNHRIRRLGTDGNMTTVAGNGAAGYSGDGGAATDAELNYPQAIAIDSAGNLYIADTYNHRIREVTSGGTITTIAGNGQARYAGDRGPAASASLNYPKGIAADASGNVYIADSFNSRIRLITSDGNIFTVAGNGTFGDRGDGGTALTAALRFPTGVTIASSGAIYVADTGNHRVRKLAPTLDPSAAPTMRVVRISGPAAFGGMSATAPGSWVEIYGLYLGAVARQWTSDDFNNLKAPNSLSGTRVTIGDRDAFVAYVSPSQVNVLVPSDVGLGDQTVTVTTASGSASGTITVNPTAPGMLAPSSFKIGDRQYAAATFPDGTYALPAQAISGIASRPARPSESMILYGIGFGTVTPGVDAGEIVQTANSLNLPIEISIGGIPAKVTYAGLVPGEVGVYQFDVVVPNLASSDAVPVTYSLGGVPGTQTLFVAVRN